MPEHTPLPVAGYTTQSSDKVALVNSFKQEEERLLRKIDRMQGIVPDPMSIEAVEKFGYDQRWLAIARTGFEQAFMALNRAVFQPQRISLPEDADESTPAASALGQVNE